MKKLVAILTLMATLSFADTLTIGTNQTEDRALASITARVNAERHKQFTDIVEQRKKYNADIEIKLAEINSKRSSELPKAVPADLGMALLPEVTEKEMNLAPVTPAEVLLALAAPSLSAELKAIADAEEAKQAKEALTVLNALKTLSDCASKLKSAGLNPAKFCSSK